MVPTVTLSPWTPEHDDAVARFVSQHPQGLIYYSPPFRRFLLAIAGGTCRSVLAFEDAALTGVMPVLVKDGVLGPVLNSLPFFGSYGGVLATSSAAERALTGAYERLAGEAAAATWIAHPFLDVTPPAHTMTDERIAQWTDLAAGADAVSGRIEASARRNIRRARDDGIVVRETSDGLDILEEMHRENMAAIGGRAKPRAFFSCLPQTMTFGRDWRLYVAERGGEPVAALLTFEAARTVEYVMPAIRESARASHPTAALLWHAMIDAAARGCARWNWGGTWPTQDGVYRFKKKWGAHERPYRYFVTLNDRSLLRRSASELSDEYPWYYIVPYGSLEPATSKGSS